MGLDSWLASISDRQRLFVAGLETFREQSESGMRQLSRSLDLAQQRVDAWEPERLQRARNAIDVGAMIAKLDARDLSSLSRREKRAVPAFWREVGLERMRWFLSESPESLPRFVRQRLRDWSLSETPEVQEGWARLAGHFWKEERLPRWGLPLPVSTVLGRKGPGLLAEQWKDESLPHVVEALKVAGARSSVSYTGHVVSEYLLQRLRQRRDVTESLAFLMDDARGRAWLPFVGTETSLTPAPLEARVAVVAAVLECRAQRQVGAGVQGRLEERLVSKDSVFGDPRLTTLTEAWAQVRSRTRGAFDDFLAALIQQDLEFFFERAMREQDRRDFWLRYLGSIRTTTCWLDSATYDDLRRRGDALPPEQRAAFRRARRLPKGEVSAFCLSFDRFVVVEFSETGNATFVYRHENFDRMLRGMVVEHAQNLKDVQLSTRRLIHGKYWQSRFDQELLALGIEWDRNRQRRKL
ncbi:hypothetical protein HPC49_12590 [Pyxidicoccus fallax]|uniref:Zorya protein ZorC EH domain-containing protein n=1 Tax=Pyxidicoccus fallax TaxID=394095 RepID=A0A848LQC0_9BACT|nr:EH signature domain-containing protein [Pyxidicoccus fallax]NMO19674.1 hypothetical protein [Pyxidicoccus fallax]NPC79072.1 hypothetical protein [Pyxidicoccus fallax]